jgi:hypothetical protein
MIWDSIPWKDALVHDSARIIEISLRFDDRDEDTAEGLLAEYERLIFISAFSVRKLIEGNKVSDEVRAKNVKVERIGKNSERFSLINDSDLSRYYSIKTLQLSNLSINHFLNVIIHSHFFAPIMNEHGVGLWGFFVTSDKTKDTVLFRVEIRALIEMIILVADDSITSAQFWLDEHGKKQSILTNDSLVKRG